MIPPKKIGEIIIGSYTFLVTGMIILSGRYMKYDEETVKEVLTTWI
jgi:hypothetical protein